MPRYEVVINYEAQSVHYVEAPDYETVQERSEELAEAEKGHHPPTTIANIKIERIK